MKFRNFRFEATAERHGTEVHPGKFGVLVYSGTKDDIWQSVCEFVTPTEARRMAEQLLEAAANAVLGQAVLDVQKQLKQITAEFGGTQGGK